MLVYVESSGIHKDLVDTFIRCFTSSTFIVEDEYDDDGVGTFCCSITLTGECSQEQITTARMWASTMDDTELDWDEYTLNWSFIAFLAVSKKKEIWISENTEGLSGDDDGYRCVPYDGTLFEPVWNFVIRTEPEYPASAACA